MFSSLRHRLQHHSRFLLIRVIFELKELLLERDGVVKEEPRSVSEGLWENFPGNIESEARWGIGEQEGNILSQSFGEECGECGECVVRADSQTRDGAISQDKNGADIGDLLENSSHNTLLVDIVLLDTTGIGQPRRVEDANLLKRLHILSGNAGTYYYAVLALKFVKVSRVGLTLITRTTVLIGIVEGVKVTVIDVFACKDIGDELQK